MPLTDIGKLRCPSAHSFEYKSLKLTSPDGNTTAHFDYLLDVICRVTSIQRPKSVKQIRYESRPVKLIVEKEIENVRKELTLDLGIFVDYSKRSNYISYRFANPLSFSEDGRYLMIDLREGKLSIHDTQEKTAEDFVFSSRYIGFFLIDLWEDKEPINLVREICFDMPCNQCQSYYHLFLGFQSESQAIFKCYTTSGPGLMSFDLQEFSRAPFQDIDKLGLIPEYSAHGTALLRVE